MAARHSSRELLWFVGPLEAGSDDTQASLFFPTVVPLYGGADRRVFAAVGILRLARLTRSIRRARFDEAVHGEGRGGGSQTSSHLWRGSQLGRAQAALDDIMAAFTPARWCCSSATGVAGKRMSSTTT
ncbi:protein TRANSPARENT TESTA GLABRA 1 [Iris pallida]|uniref:Protein TRANSPARENT TESTA GLABRA 1 n=1 Tax=Iris pallida TaxID=29817 RepID=A0AAX6ETE6_IRIPA|nr:protein TRANSPARENT TESTA GLABRA 1 [Iris pallida]